MNSIPGSLLVGSTTGIAMATAGHAGKAARITSDEHRKVLQDQESHHSPRIPRESFSSFRSTASTFNSSTTSSTPSLSPPPALLSLMSLGTQHLIGHTSRYRSGRPEFLLTCPLSNSNPQSSRVVHLRPARRSDLEAITEVARRSAATTAHDLAMHPDQDKYESDFARTLYWGYSSLFHDPKVVMLVAETANQAGMGAEKMKREIVGVLVAWWRGTKRKYDEVDGGRRYAGYNRTKLKPILQHHLTNISYNISWHLDRSRSRSRACAMSAGTSTFLPTSESGLDRSTIYLSVASPTDVTTDGDDEGGPYWQITDVCVAPEHTGTGIGGRLVGLWVAAARERAEMVTLTAVPGVEPFYEKAGFRRFGEFDIKGEIWTEMYLSQVQDQDEKGRDARKRWSGSDECAIVEEEDGDGEG